VENSARQEIFVKKLNKIYGEGPMGGRVRVKRKWREGCGRCSRRRCPGDGNRDVGL